MGKRVTNRMPQVSFSILFALSLKPRHGYELMQQIEDDSAGKLSLGPGALYSAIKQLREQQLIEEVPFADKNQRRRYYRLTKKGWDALRAELDYFRSVVVLAEDRKLLGNNLEQSWLA